MFFFPAVTTTSIQNFIPPDPGLPGIADNSAGRTGLHALPAFTAAVLDQRLSTIQRQMGENRPQPHPGAVFAGNQQTIAADPANTGPGCSRLMWKFTADIDGIRAF